MPDMSVSRSLSADCFLLPREYDTYSIAARQRVDTDKLAALSGPARSTRILYAQYSRGTKTSVPSLRIRMVWAPSAAAFSMQLQCGVSPCTGDDTVQLIDELVVVWKGPPH